MTVERLKELLCTAYVAYVNGDQIDADELAEMRFVVEEMANGRGALRPQLVAL